jgi:hypothetical protein
MAWLNHSFDSKCLCLSSIILFNAYLIIIAMFVVRNPPIDTYITNKLLWLTLLKVYALDWWNFFEGKESKYSEKCWGNENVE